MNKSWIPGLSLLLLLLVLGAWWAQNTRVEMAWEPEWPEAVRVSGLGVESLPPGKAGTVSAGDRARAVERARWKAYYYAQLRAAEQIRGLTVDAETTIRDLGEMSQELRSSMAGTIAAAVEIPSEERVEILDDAVQVRVVVEVPAPPLEDLRQAVKVLLEAGHLRFERRLREEPAVQLAEALPELEEAPEPGEETREIPAPASSSEEPREVSKVAWAEAPATPSARRTPSPPEPEPARRPPRAVRSPGTGAVVFVAHGAGHLGAAPWIYDAGGTELGSALDLPPQRLAAGLRLVSAGDAAVIHEVVGSEPKQYTAGVSMGDLFLEEHLDSEEARRFKTWLSEDRLVLVLEDSEA